MNDRCQINDADSRALLVMPVILATEEAEIRRIMVRSQPGQIVCETLSRKKPFTRQRLT
jgi:hypothetical protein